MKHLRILAWWLLLLVAMETAAYILDGSHYLFWGVAGVHFLKFAYLGFACVLFFRYLSFRSQKSLEYMVESYNRIAEKPAKIEKLRKDSWVNPFLHLLLVVLTSVNFTLVFHWNETVFQASILLDFLIWLLALRWVARTYWLKSLGKRERIKEFLDDSRSRMKSENPVSPDIEKRTRSMAPYLTLAGLGFFATVLISGLRWEEASRTYRVDDLKACMIKCMGFAAERFYQNGQLEIELAQEACIQEKGKQIKFNLDLLAGEIYLSGKERDSYDFFGNSVLGDEGLVLDPAGRFRKSWVGPIPD